MSSSADSSTAEPTIELDSRQFRSAVRDLNSTVKATSPVHFVKEAERIRNSRRRRVIASWLAVPTPKGSTVSLSLKRAADLLRDIDNTDRSALTASKRLWVFRDELEEAINAAKLQPASSDRDSDDAGDQAPSESPDRIEPHLALVMVDEVDFDVWPTMSGNIEVLLSELHNVVHADTSSDQLSRRAHRIARTGRVLIDHDEPPEPVFVNAFTHSAVRVISEAAPPTGTAGQISREFSDIDDPSSIDNLQRAVNAATSVPLPADVESSIDAYDWQSESTVFNWANDPGLESDDESTYFAEFRQRLREGSLNGFEKLAEKLTSNPAKILSMVWSLFDATHGVRWLKAALEAIGSIVRTQARPT